LGGRTTYYYSLLYSITILIFGVRRILVQEDPLISNTRSCPSSSSQVFFLFLLPFHLFEPLIKAHFSPEGYVMREIFPSGKWSCFGLVLFWPLDMNDFGTSSFLDLVPFRAKPSASWRSSYGNGQRRLLRVDMQLRRHAENPGRRIPRQRPARQKGQEPGQYRPRRCWPGRGRHRFRVFHQPLGNHPAWVEHVARRLQTLHRRILRRGAGLGVYFSCRDGSGAVTVCPLAALMHIYSRFSKYRIFAEKKKLHPCNICTKVCHMASTS